MPSFHLLICPSFIVLNRPLKDLINITSLSFSFSYAYDADSQSFFLFFKLNKERYMYIRIGFHFDFLELGDYRGKWLPTLQLPLPLLQSKMPHLHHLYHKAKMLFIITTTNLALQCLKTKNNHSDSLVNFNCIPNLKILSEQTYRERK